MHHLTSLASAPVPANSDALGAPFGTRVLGHPGVVGRSARSVVAKRALSGQSEQDGMVAASARLVFGRAGIRLFRDDDSPAVAAACADPAIGRFTFMKDGLTEDEARGLDRAVERDVDQRLSAFRRSATRETIGSWDRSAWRSLSSIKARRPTTGSRPPIGNAVSRQLRWDCSPTGRSNAASSACTCSCILRTRLPIVLPHDAASPARGLTGLRTRQGTTHRPRVMVTTSERPATTGPCVAAVAGCSLVRDTYPLTSTREILPVSDPA